MTTLYRKYRPQKFSDVIGQGHIVQTLSNAILHGRIGQAYLFTGPRGTGKTTMARIFARAVNCTSPQGADPCLKCENCQNILGGKSFDVFEIDAASNTGVDNIRELRETVKLPPTQGKYKVYIIDEVHMLSTGAFNALLKTLEEPPAHVIFILATTEIHKVPETIISRCQRFDFARLSLEHIITKLSLVAQSEKIEVEKSALEMIAIAAEGGMRDAESLLAQVIALEDKKITAKEVEEILGTSQWEAILQMGQFLVQKDAQSAIALVDQLTMDGYDLEVFHKALLNFLRQLLLVAVSPELAKTFAYELTSEQSAAIINLAKQSTAEKVLHIIECFTDIQGKIKSAFIPQLPLEIAIVKAVSEPQAKPVATQEPLVKINPAHVLQSKAAPKPVQPIAPTAPITPTTTAQSQTPQHTTPIEPIAPIETPAAETNPAINTSLTLNEVERKWLAFCEAVKLVNTSLATVFPMAHPYKVENGTIFLAAKYPFHKDKLNDQANKLTMEASFAKILGSSVRVKAVTMQEAGLSEPKSSLESHGASAASTEPKETSSLLSDALSMMGGQIVE